MFKLDGSLDRYLFVYGGRWVIRSSLEAKKALMRSGYSGQICPAHPSNFSTSKPDLDLNIWEFNKADENQEENFEEGVVLLRCSVHDADHAQWLVEQAREGQMEKEKVGALLCEEDNKRSVLISLLDEETQRQAATFNKTKTCSAVTYMEYEGDFLPWLYEEAEKGEWDQKMVFAALAKEEVDGKTVIVARRKKGKTFQHQPLFKTISPNAALEISSSGPAGEYQGALMGRFELVVGEERDGSPVYRQAHSGEIPSDVDYLLYR